MRLDLYLKLSRLVPRRSLAKDLCDEGQVLVDDQPAKAGREVRAGERIRLRLPARELLVEILELPSARSVSRAAARELYRTLEEKRFDLWGRERQD
jgi:ribosomal 50S subunit-recycling heat shock protein